MASMSKRAQARTERELHDLLRAPGNSTCADCGARNPSWASWNLGVFLCMRCASIHRKLGTHISKVKSLSMDTWTSDQLESMKRQGNLVVNKTYNSKNKKPDMPLDADEVDGAMERFIRKKYQEKSLSDGRPEVPSRDDAPLPRSKSPDSSPPPALPVKKNRFFGFGLRASSSAYPLSKHDKKHRNEPRVDSTFRISSEDYTSAVRTNGSRSEVSDHDLQVKLAQLRDMGFSDDERNTNILKRHNGDVERAIAALVKMGPSDQPTARKTTPQPAPAASTVTNTFPTIDTAKQTSVSAPQSATVSNNPYMQMGQPVGFGLSAGGSAPQSANPVSANPWQSSMSSQPNTGLEQSFSNMQVSQPLFPHSTGGYPGQPQYPPQQGVPSMFNSQQQYTMTSSPVSVNNPFMQAPLSAHSTGSNPYAAHIQSIPNFAPSTNPFLNMAPSANPQQASPPNSSFNPFGLPPSNSPPQARTQPIVAQPQPDMFGGQPMYQQSGMQQQMYSPGAQHTPQQQFGQTNGQQSPQGLLNFQQGQPQFQQHQQQQQQQQFQQQTQPQQPSTMAQYYQTHTYSPPQQQQQFQQQPFTQTQPQSPQMQQQQYQQPIMPQQTGHMDKKSILALYNMPQLAPPKPLASIPEPADDQSQGQQPQIQQQVSPAPSGMVYGNFNSVNPGKRSATMPASSMHSAGGTGSRNPFMNSNNSSGASTPSMTPQQFPGYAQGTRHVSHDSVAVNNPNLQEGRHSPDAFANLSARYVR